MLASLFTLLLLASDPAAATPHQGHAPATNQVAAADEQKKICKRQPVTGQRIGSKRICMTAEQWKAAEDAAARGSR